MSTPLHSVPVDTPLAPHDPQAPPYSPALINLNNRFNMTASSLTEALLLLSGMYISLVQPEPGPIKIGLHAVFPRTTATFRSAITDPFSERNKFRTFLNYGAVPAVFDISTSYTRSEYTPKELLDMLCNEVFPKNTITIFYLNNHLGLQQFSPPTARYLPRILESLGLPIISYDTQFSPNARPALSIQLAPTMGQMMDVVFAFLKKFNWTDFSFLCTLSYGCLDEIASIRAKVDESQRKPRVSVYGVETFSYRLLSYVNFTDGKNKNEVRGKLKYELHKDSRINLVHGSGAEVKTIMDIAKEQGLTGEEYVWIFTAASISISQENAVVDNSYPLGSFIIGFDSSRDDMEDVVKIGVNLWLEALNSLVISPEFESIDFKTGFSCDRVKDSMTQKTNGTTRSPLFWKYGEILYKYILKSKLPGGLKFDEYGILKTNKFWIMNVQSEASGDYIDDDYDGRTSWRSRTASVAEQSGSAHHSDDSFLFERSPGTEMPSPGHTRGNDRNASSLFSLRRGSRLPVPRDRDLWIPYHEVEDSRFGNQMTLEIKSRVSRESRSLLSQGRNSRISKSTGIVLESSLTISNIARHTSRESSLPLSKDQGDALHFSKENNSGSLFSQDRFSGLSSPGIDSGLHFSRHKKSESAINKHKNLSSADNEISEYSSEGSNSLSSSQIYSSGHPHLSHNLVTSNTAYSSLDDNSVQLQLSERGNSKIIPTSSSRIFKGNNTPVSGASSKNLSDSQHSFIQLGGESSNPLSHKTARYKENVPGYEHSRADYNNVYVQEAKSNREYLETQNRIFFVRTGEFKRRSRRAVARKQFAKKIADWNGHSLSMAGIMWPGGSFKPPKGKPEKYILKVITWKEDPHVIYMDKKNTSSHPNGCDANSLPCKVYIRDKHLKRTNGTKDMCCTGLSIDLLRRLGELLHFDVELSEVPDGGYGSPLNKNLTEWNGMLGMLIHNEADMAIGALSITPERSVAVDFSVPFLQTGIAIIVAIREGVISPTAFLEPYDYPSWSLILVFSVHATGASIFIFEWLSPYGLNQGKTSLSVHKFSLFRSFWLIWAMLFGASVSTDQPRGIASRFLANIWALFAVVFCASYTANLAAFMITKDDFYDLSGIQDWRLKNPHHRHPPFKFATIANSSTDLNIEKNYKEIYRYMKSEAQTDVKDAIKNLKKGHIQAFIYDSTTLEYEVGKDDFCKLKTVGKRIAETGYGVAFPRRSQWVQEVNKALLHLQENGDIERLQKFWLAGACHKKKEPGVSSHTLGILNFTSAFILLGAGVILGVVLLILEHIYFRFGRKSLKKWDKHGCCSLVSLSMGQSLTFEQSVMEAIDYHKHHKCKDPLCETQLWKVRYDLDIALLKISQLRKQIAYSASLEVAKGKGGAASPENGLDITYQNGTARRRRQQASDISPACVDKSVNQSLLALEGKNEMIDDDTQHPSTHTFVQFSQTASFPAAKYKVAARENSIPLYDIHHFYCEKPSPSNNVKTTLGGFPAGRLSTSKSDIISDGTWEKMTDLELHPLPPTFDEVMSGYLSSTEKMMTSSTFPSLPLPPSLSLNPASPEPPHQSHPENILHLSDSNTSNLFSSLNNKHFMSVISDSPESPLLLPFSEESKKCPKSSCAISKFVSESPSIAASQNADNSSSELISTPFISLDDSRALTTSRYANSHFNNAQVNCCPSSVDTVRLSKVRSNLKQETKTSNLVPSRIDDVNDVSIRQVYVNVDEIIGKETSF